MQKVTLVGWMRVSATVEVEIPEGAEAFDAAMELPSRPWVDGDGKPVHGEIIEIEVEE